MATPRADLGWAVYALPVAAVIGIAAIPRLVGAAKRTREWIDFMYRAPGDVRPGPGHFLVEALGTEPTNLGFSNETPRRKGGGEGEGHGSSTAAKPTLATEPIVLQIVNGPRVRMVPGQKLRVAGQGIVGAKRRLIESVTTAQGGISNKFSFDVSPTARFWLECDLVLPPPQAGGGYRGDQIFDVRPIGDTYVAQSDQFMAPNMLSAWILSGLIGQLIGTFLGVFLVMFITTGLEGCGKGKQPVHDDEMIAAVFIGLVFSALATHLGFPVVIPNASLKMVKQGNVFVLR